MELSTRELKSTQDSSSANTEVLCGEENLISKGAPERNAGSGTPLIMVTPGGRKVPRCTKCGRPKRGHPRSGCPFVDSPLEVDASVTPDSRGKGDVGSMLIEASGLEADVVPAQDLVRNDAEAILSPSTSSNSIVVQPSHLGVSYIEGNNIAIAPEHFQEPPEVTATAATSPATENGAQSLKTKLQTTPYTPIITSHIPLSASDLCINQASLSTNSMPSLNEQLEKKEEPEENAELGQAEPCHQIPESNLQSASAVERDSFVVMIPDKFEAAPAIIIIPSPNADAILNQAAAMFKFDAKWAANKVNEDSEAVPIQVLLGHEEKALQTFISAVMATIITQVSARKVRLRGGLSTLQTAVAAAVVGAIGAWIAMAFV